MHRFLLLSVCTVLLIAALVTSAALAADSSASALIFYDTAAPPDLRHFRIQFNAEKTSTLDVILDIAAFGATHMRFKNTYAGEWGAWAAYANRAPWRLADGPSGPRAVYCQCKDSLGSLSMIRADTIIFERR